MAALLWFILSKNRKERQKELHGEPLLFTLKGWSEIQFTAPQRGEKRARSKEVGNGKKKRRIDGVEEDAKEGALAMHPLKLKSAPPPPSSLEKVVHGITL